MDLDNIRNAFKNNARTFQRTLDKIAEKYAKVQYENDALEVDLDNMDTLERILGLSQKNLDKIEAMSVVDLTQESLQDITRDPSFDTTSEESGSFDTTGLSEVTQNDTTRYSGSLDESQSNYTFLSDQPEDQDEELEVSLQSRGSSLGQCYPDMVSQIENAWRRQQVSEAADTVRRRYRRWRKTTRGNRMDSSHVQSHSRESIQEEPFLQHHHSLRSPVKSVASPVTKAVSSSPGKILRVNGQKSQYCSPVRRREAPVVVMDMAAIEKESKAALNKTIIISEPSVFCSTFASSSSRSYSPNKPCQDLTFRMKSMSPRHLQTATSSVHGGTLLKERSPVRASPYKAQLTSRDSFNEWTNIYGSPMRKGTFKLHANKGSPVLSPYSRVASPKSPYMRPSFSNEFQRSAANFIPSPSKLSGSRRTLEYPDERLSQQWSPQLGKPRRLKRCLSFDSSTQASRRPFTSSKDFDTDFIKLYHKLVCQNKSSFLRSHPCRFCAKNSEATRGHSLSNLAALALSPHRPLLRKRHGDMQNYPQSKRFRDGPAHLKY